MSPPDAAAGGVLLGYQRRWLEDTAEIKVCEKSRRIGLTWSEASDSALCAARARNPVNTYYISYNKEMTREFVDTCAYWAKRYGEAAAVVEEVVIVDEDEDITIYRITFASGAEIVGLPGRPTVLRGKQGRVIIDEAGFVDNLGELLKAAIALLMWGAQVIVISTHNGVDNEFNELVQEIRAGKRPRSSLHKIDIEDAIADGLYRRILERKAAVTGVQEEWTAEGERQWLADLVGQYGEAAQEELYCIPSQGGQKYFPRALVERAMSDEIPVITYERASEFTYRADHDRQADCEAWIDEHLEPVLAAARERAEKERTLGYLGMDFARSGDLSVIALFVETLQLSLVATVYIEMRNVPFAQQFQIFCAAVDGTTRFGAAAIDARGNGQMIAELAAQKYGPYIHEVMISRRTYLDYMPPYKARYEDQTITIPNHAGILDDHRAVVLDRGVAVIREHTTDAGGGKRHGDAAVAGMLAEYAVRQDEGVYQPLTYEPVGSAGIDYWRPSGGEEAWEEE